MSVGKSQINAKTNGEVEKKHAKCMRSSRHTFWTDGTQNPVSHLIDNFEELRFDLGEAFMNAGRSSLSQAHISSPCLIRRMSQQLHFF